MSGQSPSRRVLGRLGAGEPVASVCAAEGIEADAFDAWWRREAAGRVPAMDGRRAAAVAAPVRIDRDARGVPHVHADDPRDLFFGFGYAMAADRLFQLDYLRRKASGRLAEVLGPEGIESDRIARVVGLRRIAEAEWSRLAPDVRASVEDFTRGVNALMQATRDAPPIEFDLLDYRPEPWSPVDSLAIEVEFRWYLTGRLPVVALPELAKQTLGDGPLYRAFLKRESDAESVVPEPSFAGAGRAGQPFGPDAVEPYTGQGSNNWAIAGRLTPTGSALVASDPHIAIEAVSCWYPVHLEGGPYRVAGMAYVGMPAVMFGRNRDVAWGCTNNICSLRDLYRERADPAHPGCFLHGGAWEPAEIRTEEVAVRGGEPVHVEVVTTRNGPLVDELLPGPVRGAGLGPVSLRWLGATHGGWLTALLGMNRAGSIAELREAMRPWHVPTFSVVYADAKGRIGCQVTGRIPVRRVAERGFRPGWEPEHQWAGLIPFEAMPHRDDPPRGWAASANNRPVPDDYPYPMAGTWSDDLRARRIRELIEGAPRLDRARSVAMLRDTASLRAEACVPRLLAALASADDPRVGEAVEHLRSWDRRMEPESVGAALFNAFFAAWTKAVAAERFEGPELVELLAPAANGLAAHLLDADPDGWFAPEARSPAIVAAFRSTLDELARRLGDEMATWSWGRLHTLTLRHVLSGRGDLARLLDRGGVGVPGDMVTVFNTGSGPDLEAKTGAGFRMIAEPGADPPGLWAIDAPSQSGHPGSPHYDDQFEPWLRGESFWIPLGPVAEPRHTLTLAPEVD